jgi:hypothetical protein
MQRLTHSSSTRSKASTQDAPLQRGNGACFWTWILATIGQVCSRSQQRRCSSRSA